MIIYIKNRLPILGKKVYIYKNLHKKCYSIKQDGLVIGYMTAGVLFDCTFIVQKAGREKVRKTKLKNVHAYICGYLTGEQSQLQKLVAISYSPYSDLPFFCTSIADKPRFMCLSGAKEVVFKPYGVFINELA